jgi:hypothetical protein
MSEAAVPGLIVVGALILIGIFLLVQRIGRKASSRDSASFNEMMKAPLRSSPSSPSSNSNEDLKFLERLSRGEGLKADAVPPKRTHSQVDKGTEQTFRSMFFTSADRGEGLIEHYMTRHGCDRAGAMRRAITDREREARD